MEILCLVDEHIKEIYYKLPDRSGQYRGGRRCRAAACLGSVRRGGTAAAARTARARLRTRTNAFRRASRRPAHTRFALALRQLSLCLRYILIDIFFATTDNLKIRFTVQYYNALGGATPSTRMVVPQRTTYM